MFKAGVYHRKMKRKSNRIIATGNASHHHSISRFWMSNILYVRNLSLQNLQDLVPNSGLHLLSFFTCDNFRSYSVVPCQPRSSNLKSKK